MSKRTIAPFLLLASIVFLQAEPGSVQGLVDPCHSIVTANLGVVVACPRGDGDPLTSPAGGGNCQITLTVVDAAHRGIAGIPSTDMWLVGCNDRLLLCGGSSGSSADRNTDATGTTTFSNEPVAGGCDSGLYVVVEGVIIQDPLNCVLKCLPIAVRSPDYKSDAGCGAIDAPCPDAKVDDADFSWFAYHYPYPGHPATYFACADYAAPLGVPIDLADFVKFSLHFVPGHHCLM